MRERIAASIGGECPSIEIGAYIDGELTSERELELELHFSGCKACADELNLQKKLHVVLNSNFERECEIELPADFSKIVAANAESNVAGLRTAGERRSAAFVCSAIALFALFALGADVNNLVAGLAVFIDKSVAVIGFVTHLSYDVAIGAVVILRSLGSQLFSDSILSILLSGFAAIAILAFSRFFLRVGRT